MIKYWNKCTYISPFCLRAMFKIFLSWTQKILALNLMEILFRSQCWQSGCASSHGRITSCQAQTKQTFSQLVRKHPHPSCTPPTYRYLFFEWGGGEGKRESCHITCTCRCASSLAAVIPPDRSISVCGWWERVPQPDRLNRQRRNPDWQLLR